MLARKLLFGSNQNTGTVTFSNINVQNENRPTYMPGYGSTTYYFEDDFAVVLASFGPQGDTWNDYYYPPDNWDGGALEPAQSAIDTTGWNPTGLNVAGYDLRFLYQAVPNSQIGNDDGVWVMLFDGNVPLSTFTSFTIADGIDSITWTAASMTDLGTLNNGGPAGPGGGAADIGIEFYGEGGFPLQRAYYTSPDGTSASFTYISGPLYGPTVFPYSSFPTTNLSITFELA